jgi:hypothetical protein
MGRFFCCVHCPNSDTSLRLTASPLHSQGREGRVCRRSRREGRRVVFRRRDLPLATVFSIKERERELGGGGSLPLASARCAVFRYPLCGALPRNAP